MLREKGIGDDIQDARRQVACASLAKNITIRLGNSWLMVSMITMNEKTWDTIWNKKVLGDNFKSSLKDAPKIRAVLHHQYMQCTDRLTALVPKIRAVGGDVTGIELETETDYARTFFDGLPVKRLPKYQKNYDYRMVKVNLPNKVISVTARQVFDNWNQNFLELGSIILWNLRLLHWIHHAYSRGNIDDLADATVLYSDCMIDSLGGRWVTDIKLLLTKPLWRAQLLKWVAQTHDWRIQDSSLEQRFYWASANHTQLYLSALLCRNQRECITFLSTIWTVSLPVVSGYPFTHWCDFLMTLVDFTETGFAGAKGEFGPWDFETDILPHFHLEEKRLTDAIQILWNHGRDEIPQYDRTGSIFLRLAILIGQRLHNVFITRGFRFDDFILEMKSWGKEKSLLKCNLLMDAFSHNWHTLAIRQALQTKLSEKKCRKICSLCTTVLEPILSIYLPHRGVVHQIIIVYAWPVNLLLSVTENL
jgi:hypothetical protein